MMKSVATEEEWIRIIRLWSPEFKITYRSEHTGEVITIMQMWAVGAVSCAHNSIEEALSYGLQACEKIARAMCLEIENEQRR